MPWGRVLLILGTAIFIMLPLMVTGAMAVLDGVVIPGALFVASGVVTGLGFISKHWK